MQDVTVIGGSFAGLTAALQLGRASRTVSVIDAGAPRNRTSPAAHGVPGWDGTAPADILDGFGKDASAYSTVEFLSDTVVGVSVEQDGFVVSLATHAPLKTRRVLLAHGVVDTLPDLPGIAEVWGKTLLHCPYCHGFEVRNRPLAVLANHAMSGHQAQLLHADWSSDVTVLTGTQSSFDPSDFARDGFKMETRPVIGLSQAGDGISVSFEGGSSTEFAAVFTAPLVSLSGTPAEMLRCATTEGPLGPFLQVGPMGQTSVPGVFAAGDCARPAHNVTSAIGDGAMAGIGCHQSLVFPGMIQPIEAAA
ncbi:NAD(P)/FAD-dependent oxidoreductase [Roseobacter weihaiensis]|uniref:NAD(P)/FAD-dependent oxidoreductase n=1 Tax=Roseobacter weihaiensis TaxID=2763262 RepID=UPI001D0B1E52|nr:NAD(P)/FAD-dependent oxidoreductase [Roseobacter sp. H9]